MCVPPASQPTPEQMFDSLVEQLFSLGEGHGVDSGIGSARRHHFSLCVVPNQRRKRRTTTTDVASHTKRRQIVHGSLRGIALLGS